jgi:Uma2 family endonuclease
MVTALAQPQPIRQPHAQGFENYLNYPNYPGEADLPSEYHPMENSLHADQVRLLVTILQYYWQGREDYFIGDNLTIFYSLEQTKKNEFRGPDFFVVKNTSNRPRNSWVVWEENKFPEVIIELLSPSTAAQDRGEKKEVYEQRFRTPEYFWFSPETGEFEGFRLQGNRYVAIQPNQQGWRWSQELDLFLGIHDGLLRYFTADGNLIPTPIDFGNEQARRAEAEAQRADTAIQRADTAIQRVEQLAAKLRALGIDPDQP